MHDSVTKIQSMYRAKLARTVYRKRFTARSLIQTHLLTYMNRRKWERNVESYAGNFLENVIKIQKEFRWRRRWGQVLNYVMQRKKSAVRI